MALTLYRNGSVYSSADPFATAMVVDGNTIAWLGGEEAADRQAERVDEVIDLQGGLITPAFVESHAHLAALGRTLAGGDLSSAADREALLEQLSRLSAEGTGPVLAHGWDESNWADPQLPTPVELDAAAAGRGVYLSRRDKHSALVNAQLLADLELDVEPGLVKQEAHDAVQQALRTRYADVVDYQRLALEHYASRGFAVVVEMAATHLEGRQTLDALLEIEDANLPAVYAFWGELVADAQQAKELISSFPAGRVLGLGGDLRVDGSLGSRTAYLREPYADAPGERGTLYLSVEQITAHLVACSQSGIQAAFHVIGDAALDALLDAFDAAADIVGVAKLQMCRHRIEHAEMVDEASRDRLLKYSIMVSMQPMFDAYWGGEDRMYAQRLGAERAANMNNLSAMLSAGVPLVLGSDAPVTEVNGWGIVKAAMHMANPEVRVSARAGFVGQTRSTYRAMGEMNPFAGQLAIGAPATFAVWSASELAVQTPDERISSWSTDARAGTPMLPVVDEELPTCLRTVRAGNILFDQLPNYAKS